MTLEIVPFADEHVAAAAALAARRYCRQQRDVPELPDRYGDPDTLQPMIEGIAAGAPAVAALQGGRLVGFLAAWMTPDFRAQRTTYSPEWANGEEDGGGGRVYQAMYRALSAAWAGERYFDHYLTLFACDRAGIDAWHWLGFGDTGMDALRDLGPARGSAARVDVRRAGPADAAEAMALHAGLLAHLAGPPIFLVDAAQGLPGEIVDWLADPANALWLAWRDGQVVGSLGIQPANDNACTVIRDPGTASITSAFTRPEARGQEVGTALLQAALGWARARGFVRCSVDFETANLEASHFWLRHFRPVCHSLGRRVNPHIAEV